MSQAVSTQDASSESFARLLNRLTRTSPVDLHPLNSLSGDDSQSASDSVRVSISERGTALSNSRKRSVAPVRFVTQNASRSNPAINETSYERALRLHSRLRTTALPEPLPPSSSKEEISGTGTQASSRLNAEAKALAALRRAANQQVTSAAQRALEKKASVPPAPAGRSSRAIKENAVGKSASRGATKSASDTAVRRKSSRANQAKESPALSGNPSPAKASAVSAPASHKRSKSTNQAQYKRAPKIISPEISSSLNSPSESLQLELSSRATALMQRQSIVSIRLNAYESEQLRERAAESGISVSAYMRSCVLEAEHLRAQVKQALAEMRAAHGTLPHQAQTLTPVSNSGRAMHTSVVGFFTGIVAFMIGRFQR
jgi:hypothetical protein